MNLVYIYELLLYYCSLLLIANWVLGCKPRKIRLFSFFLMFIPPIVLDLIGYSGSYLPLFAVFSWFLQFVLIKLVFKDVRTEVMVFCFILLNYLCGSITSVIVNFQSSHAILIEVCVNTVVHLLCAGMCFTKLRYPIRSILDWTPRHVLIILSLLLHSNFWAITVAMGLANRPENDAVRMVLPIAMPLAQLSLLVLFPIFLFKSVSNNQLKALTENYEQQIQVQAEHYKQLSEANFEARRFRHDFRNISIAIEKSLADGQGQQALALIRECNQKLETRNRPAFTFDTGNGIADALLADKQEKAAACKAVISFQGSIPQGGLSPTDLCVILGNTLDNAIEACQKLPPESAKVIRVTCNCSSGFLFLTIENPVVEKVVVSNNHIVTTKENKTSHGFGLYSLHSVVRKYDGSIMLSSTDDHFTIEIDLCQR